MNDWRSDSEAREAWGIHVDFEYLIATSGSNFSCPVTRADLDYREITHNPDPVERQD